MGFPEGYRDAFKLFFVFDRVDAKSIQYVCANTTAASVEPGQPFPYGSVLVFETWRPLEDAQGNVTKDANGHLVRASLNTIFAMRKEQGFGTDYKDLRSGEWEYVAYRPDRTHQTPPERTASCASCHLAAAGQQNDFVFRTKLFFTPDRYGQSDPTGPGEVGISRVSYQPGTFTVKAGTPVTWRNSTIDDTPHTVTANDRSFDSGVLEPGKEFTYTFATLGTYAYTCSLHPNQMRGTIRVTE
ncbi:MAG: cytochrome P460 family protein [Chloroflexi bacterium]|nr:cytochrome P460 family protein [Chloroflexota bacterium]